MSICGAEMEEGRRVFRRTAYSVCNVIIVTQVQ